MIYYYIEKENKKSGDSMMGKSHIVVNTCSLIILESGLLLTQYAYHGVGSELLKNGATIVSRFVFPKPIFSMYMLLCLLLFYLGTLLPDIDSKNSLLGRFIYLPVKHKTWTHTIYGPFLIFVGSVWYLMLFWLGLGYILHLFWDSLSYCGVCFFYPFSKYREYNSGAKVKVNHKFKIYRTGKTSEYVVVAVLVTLTGVLLVWGTATGLYLPLLKLLL